jgi:penicillin-insensitive murein endopeptidase
MTRWALALTLLAVPACAAPVASVTMGDPQRVPQTPPVLASRVSPPVATGGPTDASLALAATGDPPKPAASAPGDEEAAALEDDDDEQTPSLAVPQSSPAVALSDAEIDRRFHHDLASLGPASVGPASAGALVNGVQMPQGEHWSVRDPGRAWGTQETVDALVHCIERVNQRYPGAPPLSIGHLSAKNGGHLSPHKSHQSGRDADIGYYYKAGSRPFIHATEDNLDLPRTWALIKAAIKETTVEMILVDRAVQKVLADYASQNGEDPAFVDEVFQIRGKNARAPIRHIKGHDNHIHFRFHNPVAETMGRRVARFVVVPRAPAPGVRVAASQAETAGFAQIRARSGDTLVVLARRYGTSVEEIQRANGLAGNAIRAGFVYKIPQKAAPAPQARPVRAPARVAQHKPSVKVPAPKQGARSGTPAPER